MKKNDVIPPKKMHDDRSATGTRRKLSLHRETLRHLKADELHLADGGAAYRLESWFRACDI